MVQQCSRLSVYVYYIPIWLRYFRHYYAVHSTAVVGIVTMYGELNKNVVNMAS